MTKRSTEVLGIDFGTSNTYFCKCPSSEINVKSIEFLGRDGITSTILYCSNGRVIIGDPAIEEWVELSLAERSKYELHFNFKPDIEFSEVAVRDSINFLRKIQEIAQDAYLDLNVERIIVGSPSRASENFKNLLKNIFSKSGYKSIEIRDEPVGALLNALSCQEISPGSAYEGGVLAIDMGGGTCDFSYLRGTRVERSWGDMFFGGRLFDDLFFSWYLDKIPGVLQKLKENGDDFFVLLHESKKFKEKFSNQIVSNPDCNLGMGVSAGLDRHYKTAKGFTLKEFQERARQYQASETFLDILKGYRRSDQVSELIEKISKPVDLFGWYRDTLLEEIGFGKIPREEIKLVLLCGGSSQWKWLAEITAEELNLSREQIKRSGQPQRAIAAGLATLPALQFKAEESIRTLQANKEQNLKNLEQELERRGSEKLQKIAESYLMEILDRAIPPALEKFTQEGGSLKKLETGLNEAIKTYQDDCDRQGKSKKRFEEFEIEISGYCQEQFEKWLKDAKIKFVPPDRVKLQQIDVADIVLRFEEFTDFGIAKELIGVFVDIVIGAVGTILAIKLFFPADGYATEILVGSGVAIGMAYHAVILRKKVDEAFKASFSLPLILWKILFNTGNPEEIPDALKPLTSKISINMNKKLNEGVKKKSNSLAQSWLTKFKRTYFQKIRESIAKVIETEIKALGELSQF